MSGDQHRAAVERVRVQVATPNDVWLSSRAEHDKLCADVGSLLALLEEQAGEVERLRLAILGGEDAPGLAMSLTLEQVLTAHTEIRACSRDRAEAAEARVKALEGALSSAALNLDACAVAIKKGGKSEGRHTLVEGWAERARSALNGDQK